MRLISRFVLVWACNPSKVHHVVQNQTQYHLRGVPDPQRVLDNDHSLEVDPYPMSSSMKTWAMVIILIILMVGAVVTPLALTSDTRKSKTEYDQYMAKANDYCSKAGMMMVTIREHVVCVVPVPKQFPEAK